MTDILRSPQMASPSSSVDDGFHSLINPHSLDFFMRNNSAQTQQDVEEEQQRQEKQERVQLSVLAAIVTAFRKSLVGCRSATDSCRVEELMEIGWPTNVRHVAHVTFDRFNGFLGLPVEFEPEVPIRPPSASTRVFGVSTESMQLSFDSRGNCVPTILLMMQRRLYSQGGLQAEGIFRINPENSQEEYVREQLNNGEVPENIEVHCLAGLIKAWFRELPRGVLDSLPPDEVMRAQSEEECTQLVRLLPPTDAALLDWTINLMTDVAQFEDVNKMNARNIAMVFAPNMTQMADPLTALMYAVQVMNFLRTLVEKTLRERKDNMVQTDRASTLEPSNRDDSDGPSGPTINESIWVTMENSSPTGLKTGHSFLSSIKNIFPGGKWHMVNTEFDRLETGSPLSTGSEESIYLKSKSMETGESSNSSVEKVDERIIQRPVAYFPTKDAEKKKGLRITSQISSPIKRVEAWR